jgi:hypothetical protein
MNYMALSDASGNHDVSCVDVAAMAERELGAFFSAVKRMFGAEQAERAADDWLAELALVNDLPVATREWRLITITAARRLAARLSGSSRRA